MKKLLVSLALAGASFVSAQKYEVSVAYGTPSVYGVSNSIFDSVGNLIMDGSAESGESNGVLDASVMMYNDNMKWRYGIGFNMETFDEKGSVFKTQSFVSIMPKVDYFWSDSDRKLRFYSGVALGVLFKKGEVNASSTASAETIKETVFGFNLMPIGIRYGGDFGVFLEPSIGTRGFVQAGVSYIF